ncbi:MAG: DUF502 domain-containing protein [Halorubrum sp.]
MGDETPARPGGNQMKGYFKQGLLFVIPTALTVGIFVLTFRFVSGFLGPVVPRITDATGIPRLFGEVVVLLALVGFVFLLGAVIETIPHGVEATDFFHSAVESIPGVGTVYAGFREMSETVANGEESFRDVKLVEYPSDGSYTMAFVTADAPPSLEASAGHEEEGMVSLFLPMGPNPVMGGFVIYVARDRVHDIDLTVEEGIQAIITSGVTVGKSDDATRGRRVHRRIEVTEE